MKKLHLLRGASGLSALAVACSVFAAPAIAQDVPPPPPGAPATPPNTGSSEKPADQSTANDSGAGDIVVTGTLFGNSTITPSPVTTVTSDELDRRGISTTQEGIQSLAANNGPALTNAFTANGAFAGGASAVSLRGLSTNSTLVLFDGLRAAYYPLADDGSRNFVDLNTIPDDIVERIEVLRDGASASYGADAIAGVVNIITKREVKGITGRAEGGVSERGDGSQYRLSLTAGIGDLNEDRYNAYISGYYYRTNEIENNQRPYPFNTSDRRGICAPDVAPSANTCGPNNVTGGLNYANQYVSGTPTASLFAVRPYDPTNTTAAGTYQTLNPSLCPGSLYSVTAADRARQVNGVSVNATAPNTVCQVDYQNLYSTITPQIERFGGSARATAKIGDTGEAYFEANFVQTTSSYDGAPAVIYGAAPTGINFPQFRTSGAGGVGTTYAVGSGFLALPIYVCPLNGQSAILANGVAQAPGGCTATTAGARLNPNNPYAAQGNVARIVGRDLGSQTYLQTRNRAYRAAAGLRGNFTDNLTYELSATAMHVDLQRLQRGYFYIQHLLNAVADGSYNFVNPQLNSAAVNNYVKPDNVNNASSDQYQAQLVLGAKLAELPGGPLQLGFGGSIRYEAVDAPSANNDINGPTQRYFTINAFGTTGSRRIYSAFAELNAPIFDQLTINAAGRYDNYSSGQDYFSPKVGAKFTPIESVTLRGTYSRGFRIPSFGEANALPTTGYVSNQVNQFNNAYLAQYGCTTATFSSCPTYIRAGSYGLTTLASPNLDPEKSRSFTGGIVFKPLRRAKISVDYFNIKKTGAITSASTAPALLAYYSGAAIPAGFTVIPDAADPNYPNATPRVAFVQSTLINSDTVRSQGIDFAIDADVDLSSDVTFSSSLNASYILKLETEFPDGTVERYDGTLGNYNLTAGSGTPKWHGTWLNSIGTDSFTLSGTVNYWDGYNLSAQDQGTGYKDGGLNPGYSPTGDDIKSYVTVDANLSFKVTDQFTFYFNVINIANRLPPIDVEAIYGNQLYNAVVGGTGILGRYFKAGVKVGF